jgi:hypothetical protein
MEESAQITVGNLGLKARAKELADYLELKVGIVDRCKVKRGFLDMPTHVFVHFASANVAKEACRLGEHGQLEFQGQVLKVCMSNPGRGVSKTSLGMHSSFLLFATDDALADFVVVLAGSSQET